MAKEMIKDFIKGCAVGAIITGYVHFILSILEK
jgi:hypothetical protein